MYQVGLNKWKNGLRNSLALGQHAVDYLNKQERMAFPFWVYYDSVEKVVWKAESTSIQERVLEQLNHFAIPETRPMFSHTSRVVA